MMWTEFEDSLPIVSDHIFSRHVTYLRNWLEEHFEPILRDSLKRGDQNTPVGLLPRR